ncbi:glycoside hydrolase family 3 C-terminal domain-containing protein [Gracilibacillus caseinilyticus]|uniref:beta-glucosidase n=1 Tax=Gracilibacillus caseinilyticus TaxID=2932256 RepID=A0ABY4EST6_9BACI|nr:glycoside hydrolase family 3 N-terminal domain-containing protein [Gracilibacillus caseinilyticus]UOQ47131.1 glycoside hydrolase family 3 C-terminal domain-containing protein [Gracilibacillus caseinilyticus]
MKNIQHLLEQMTLQEKIDQLTQLAAPFFKGAEDAGAITGPMMNMEVEDDNIRNAGSVLGASGARNIKSIQEQHLAENRLSIPLLFMSDVVHGYKTIFPIPLAIGCSWNLELAEDSARIAALESAVSGIHVTFAPMVDLVRDPRWGRVTETTGEDPLLNSLFAKAQVRGFQGEDVANDLERVAACVKHFAGYGAVEGGRDYNTVNMSDRQLHEIYLPAYKAALDQGCKMVMSSFNVIDGIPATANQTLMRDVLREQWQFDGVVISDWGAVKELIAHGVAADKGEAGLKAVLAGTDIEMMTDCYSSYLKEYVENSMLSEAIIDEAVLRILKLKEELGLFENPYRGADEQLEKEIILSDQHRASARELAVESTVLLKNEQVLPLDCTQKVALIGPYADSGNILGQWSWLGSKDDSITMLEAMKGKAENEVFFAEGCRIEDEIENGFEDAKQKAAQADVVIVAVGEDPLMSGEAGSRTNIKLPEPQLSLITELKKLGKPIVTVLFNGRPLDLHGVIENSDAVVEAWFPGTEGGQAIADLIYGDENFSGKLSMSIPHSAGQIPVYYNHYSTGRPKGAPDAQERYVSQYLDSPNGPLFPFGYGLSYTSFEYGDVQLSTDVLTKDAELTITVSVRNSGELTGKEVVQLYVQDVIGEVVRPVKELKGFQKVEFLPGEEKEITFVLSEEDFRYYHSDMTYKSDPGEFIVYAGRDSLTDMGTSFVLK